MENGKSVKFVFLNISLAIFLLPVFCYGYSAETTHPALTQETIDVFNQKYANLNLNEKERKIVIEGSKNEDSPVYRPLNHFYDPVYNKGLFSNLTAQNWSQNTRAQAGFSNLAGIGLVKDFFSADSDYSWDRAIYDYVYGDKNRALEALGHNLHLIQDMAVPPHVRDDDHLVGLDNSPYEVFTKKFDKNSLKNLSEELKNDEILIKSNLDDYFYSLAEFTNSNFFSKDTIFDEKYKYLKNSNIIKQSNENIGFIISNLGGIDYSLVGFEKIYNLKTGDNHIEYFLNDDSNVVLFDYWSLLSKQSILHGAGVMKLFFDDIEKEKKTLTLFNKNKTFLAKIGGKIANAFSKSEIIVDSTSNNLASIVDATANKTEEDTENDANIGEENPKNNTNEENFEVVDNSVDNLGDNFSQNDTNHEISQTEGLENTENDENTTSRRIESQPKYAISLSSPGFGGGGVISAQNSGNQTQNRNQIQEEQEETTEGTENSNETTISTPNSPIISSPELIYQENSNTYFLKEILTTNSITFSGLASSTNIISTDFSEITAISNENEEWILSLNNFNQGITTINFYASNSEQTVTSIPTTIEIFVDFQSPEVFLNIAECENSLSQTSCLLASDTILNISWFSNSEDFAYFTLNQNGEVSVTTATTTQISLSGNQIYTFSVSATDKNGNVSEPKTQTIEINNLPVVINEIAWAGTQASSNDEWIELYNNTDKEINLSNWILYTDDNSPNISLENTIKAHDYYLIEHKAGSDNDELTQSPVSDILADLWTSFGYGLKNSGEKVTLAYVLNNATTTVDEVNKLNNWGSKGVSVPRLNRYVSMERIDPNKPNGNNLENWATNLYNYITNGIDIDGNKILGTPKKKNSRSYLIPLGDGGQIKSNLTLKKENSPYFVNSNLTVGEGKTLTLEEGVVIKLVNKDTSLKIDGTIISNGTAENPVVFTSFYDDEFGGDTNGDGICDSSTAKCSSDGDWRRIEINPTSRNSSFKHTIFRYGGSYEIEPVKTMVLVENSDAIFENSIFEHSLTKGLDLINTTNRTLVSNSIFRDNNNYISANHVYGYGLYVENGSPVISNNVFENNLRGVFLNTSSVFFDSNIFNNNEDFAVSTTLGKNVFSNNSGLNNGKNGILLRSILFEENLLGVLKKNSLPYVFTTGDLNTVVVSSTLAIDPGVVIKFDNNSKLEVSGRLEVNDEEGEKVLFTSINDDSDGVDVNNDGNNEPSVVGQTGVYLKPTSTSKIQNSEFRYLFNALNYDNSPINLKNVTFKNNDTAIFVNGEAIVDTVEAGTIEFVDNVATSTVSLW